MYFFILITILRAKLHFFLHICKFFTTFAPEMTKFSEITASHALVKQVRSLQQKKFRDETGLFVAEGEKCVSELMKGFEPVYLFREGENATSVQIAQMSSLRTPQGVIAVFRQRSIPNPQSPITNLTLALDGVQDPGNLGTIIRTCDWFGVHDIFCSLDTADCYNPKVVQATMGALARVRIHYVDLPAWLQSLTTSQSPTTTPQSPMIFGTLLEGRNMYEVLSSIPNPQSPISNHQSPIPNPQSPISNHQFSIIIMGNEGNGISSAVRPLVTHPIRIPSFPQDAETSESLNVSIATAIVLAEFRRREL